VSLLPKSWTNPLSILSMSTGKDFRCDNTARFFTLLRLHRRLGDRRINTAAPPNVLLAKSITGASSPSPSTQNLGYMHFPDLPDGGSGAMPRRQRRFRPPDVPSVLVDAPSGPQTQWPAMTRFRNPRRDSPVAVT